MPLFSWNDPISPVYRAFWAVKTGIFLPVEENILIRRYALANIAMILVPARLVVNQSTFPLTSLIFFLTLYIVCYLFL